MAIKLSELKQAIEAHKLGYVHDCEKILRKLVEAIESEKTTYVSIAFCKDEPFKMKEN